MLPDDQRSRFDVILVGGDPYADHPSSGLGVIKRILEAGGFSVGIITRPDWKSDTDFLRCGRPRLFFGVTSGSIDSMLVNYTPLKRERRRDPHAPHDSGIPDRAVTVYCNILRRLFPGVPLVLGGIEASLRRFAHYDYWDNRVRRGLLLDSRADILVYGPGEKQVVEIAERVRAGGALDGIAGTCIMGRELPAGFIEVPSFEDVSGPDDDSRRAFCRAQTMFSNRRSLAQRHAERFVLQYPMPEYTTADLDRLYSLPFSREIPEGFPELGLAEFSVVTHRGCIGRCSFCSLALHQGDRIVSRSEASIIEEIELLTRHPDFKGYIDDLGGPSANMYGMDCSSAGRKAAASVRPDCGERECLSCRRLDRSHRRLTALLRSVRAVPGVKKVFVRSGVRFDLALASPEYVEELCLHHVSGLLKIAPEHVSQPVLELMNKAGKGPAGPGALEDFRRLFKRIDGSVSGERSRQYLKYYFMVAHPGTSMKEARELEREVRRLEREGDKPVEGVQIFTPTPMTRSTCMYYTGLDPVTGAAVFVPRTFEEKKAQKRMLEAVERGPGHQAPARRKRR